MDQDHSPTYHPARSELERTYYDLCTAIAQVLVENTRLQMKEAAELQDIWEERVGHHLVRAAELKHDADVTLRVLREAESLLVSDEPITAEEFDFDVATVCKPLRYRWKSIDRPESLPGMPEPPSIEEPEPDWRELESLLRSVYMRMEPSVTGREGDDGFPRTIFADMAFVHGDIEGLTRFEMEARQKYPGPESFIRHMSLDELNLEIYFAKERLHFQMEFLASIRSKLPHCFKDQLNDPDWVAARIADAKAEAERLEIRIEEDERLLDAVIATQRQWRCEEWGLPLTA